ncbi:MAG: hypothetical protein IKL95_03790, partial [Alphaproteobacteria bacterium]|nr:hypothetical protein [Alphaproteobacteria bacterium]
ATINVNGVSDSNTNQSTDFEGDRSLFLFARNANGTTNTFAKVKLKETIITKNGSVARNFIPAKNSSGVVGMYDTVSGTFFENAGTGEFVAGPVAE